MKTRFLAVIACFVLSVTFSFAQEWSLINPLPTNKPLYGAHFLDTEIGFVCGENGVLLRTTDGGDSWDEIETPSNGYLSAINFINNDTGFIIGGGTIFRSYDGGLNWTALAALVSSNLWDIYFLDETFGWAVGDYNAVLRTTDGGENWDVLMHSYASENYLYEVEFISPDTGYICGQHQTMYSSGVLMKTCDGGSTWVDIPLPDSTYTVVSMAVLSDGSLWISERNELHYTTDDGMNWETVIPDQYYSDFKKIIMIDELNIKILARLYFYLSVDGGLTWEMTQISNSLGMHDIACPSPDFCVAVGDGGIIMNTQDGGVTWTELSEGFRSYLSDASFYDEMRGIVAGSEYPGARIYYTVDAGYNWSPSQIDTNSNLYSIRSLDFSSDGDAWAVGWSGMMKSNDIGLSWDKVETGFDYAYNVIEVYEDKFIWAGGHSAKMIRSTDGGLQWEDISLPVEDHINNIVFCDSLHGLLTVVEPKKAGYAFLYITIDGGISWEKLPHPGDICPIFSMSYPDDTTIFLAMAYHGLMRSYDRGITWKTLGEVAGEIPTYIKFLDAETGLATRIDRLVARTEDGGETWLVDMTNNQTYGGGKTYFYDLKNGWMVGSNGLIKKYYNPFVNIPEKPSFSANEESPWVYPNPAEGKLFTRHSQNIQRVEIYDIRGDRILSFEGRDIKSINIEHLISGVYLVKLYLADEIHTEKLIKN